MKSDVIAMAQLFYLRRLWKGQQGVFNETDAAAAAAIRGELNALTTYLRNNMPSDKQWMDDDVTITADEVAEAAAQAAAVDDAARFDAWCVALRDSDLATFESWRLETGRLGSEWIAAGSP